MAGQGGGSQRGARGGGCQGEGAVAEWAAEEGAVGEGGVDLGGEFGALRGSAAAVLCSSAAARRQLDAAYAGCGGARHCTGPPTH